jgi:hypothetical protein
LPSLEQKPDYIRSQGFLSGSLRDLVDPMQALAGGKSWKGEKRETGVDSAR